MALPWQRSDNPTQVAPERRRRSRRRSNRPSPEEPRRQSARLQEERRRQRLAITIGGMLILAIFAIIAVGYYREFYEPPRVMAGEIRGVEFTMGDLVERIRVLQGINRYQSGGQVDLSVIPFQYLQDLLNAEILRQAAPGLGLRATPEDVDAAIRRQFYPTPPAGQQTDPGQLDREFENNYQEFLTQVRLSEEEYRTLVQEQLLEARLMALLGANISEKPETIAVEWIRLEHGGGVAPQEVRDRLDNERFAAVAAEVGQPVGFANQQGYVGWVPEGAFPSLDEALFGNPEEEVEPLAVGEISDPISTQEGVYIIHKLSEPVEHELTDLMRLKLNREMVENWKNDQLTRGSEEGWLKINFDSNRYAWVADQVRLTAPRVDQPQQPNQGQPAIPGTR